MQLEQLEVKKDTRGSLVEAFKFPHDGQAMYIIANPHESRGNHYHLRKTEVFLVIYGSAEITVKDRKTNNVMKVEVNGTQPMSVKIIPNHTHVITATDEGAIILAWVDEQFDPENPDTYQEEV